MGQLERYGLYVLAIVVMLIVGVAVFGEEQSRSDDVVRAETNTPWDDPVDDPSYWGEDRNIGGDSLGGDPRQLSRNLPDSPASGFGSLDGFFPSEDESDGSRGGRRDTDLDDLDADRSNLQPRDEGRDREERDRDERDRDDRPEFREEDSSSERDSRDGENDRDEPSKVRHTIRRGDTFEGIARRYYPGQNPFRVSRAIADANPNVRPTRMQLGTEIVLPVYDGTTPAARGGSGTSGSTRGVSGGAGSGSYKVRAGDTLTAIARRHYGSTSKAAINALRQANRNVDPRRLQIGQVLAIPDFQSR
ncbi:MAG: LysM domain-containing protein [Planctomycetota bacterium]